MFVRRKGITLATCCSLGLLLCVGRAHASFIETFSNGRNDSNWRLTSDPARLLRVEPSGGNPGAYLHGQVFTPVPTWYIPTGTPSTPFLGNYKAKNVTGFAFNLDIFSGVQAPNRSVTFDLQTTLGTGDFSRGIEAYEIGKDISILPSCWQDYTFSLPANSASIPAGWIVVRGDGTPGTAADWRALMADVETIGLELGKPGFAYPALNGWDLGIDNIRLRQGAPVPDSGPGILFPLLIAILCVLHQVWPRIRSARGKLGVSQQILTALM